MLRLQQLAAVAVAVAVLPVVADRADLAVAVAELLLVVAAETLLHLCRLQIQILNKVIMVDQVK